MHQREGTEILFIHLKTWRYEGGITLVRDWQGKINTSDLKHQNCLRKENGGICFITSWEMSEKKLSFTTKWLSEDGHSTFYKLEADSPGVYIGTFEIILNDGKCLASGKARLLVTEVPNNYNEEPKKVDGIWK